MTSGSRAIGREERSGVLHPDNLKRYSATFHEADDSIADVVDRFWTVDWNLRSGERIPQRVIADPAITLTVEAGHVPAGLVVTGVHRGVWKRDIEGWGSVFAIRLRPAGFGVVSDLSVDDVADATIPLSADLDRRVHSLMTHVAAGSDVDRKVAAATSAIAELLSERPLTDRQRLANAVVSAIQRGDPLPAGATSRTMQRALRETIGQGPSAWRVPPVTAEP